MYCDECLSVVTELVVEVKGVMCSTWSKEQLHERIQYHCTWYRVSHHAWGSVSQFKLLALPSYPPLHLLVPANGYNAALMALLSVCSVYPLIGPSKNTEKGTINFI